MILFQSKTQNENILVRTKLVPTLSYTSNSGLLKKQNFDVFER